MFGLSKAEKLSKKIEAILQAWGAVQFTEAMLAGEDAPEPRPLADIGILWGAADSLGQAEGLDLQTTGRGLKHFLKKFSDGDQLYSMAIAAPMNPHASPWADLFGKAIHRIHVGERPSEVFTELAQKYREKTA